MILWVRFLLTFIKGTLKGHIDLLTPHTSTFRAYPFWDAEVKFLNAARYFSFCELAICEVNVRNGFFFSFFKRGWFGVTCNVVAQYVKPVSVFKQFQVTTTVLGWDDKFFYRRVQIHQGGALKFEALYRILVVGKKWAKYNPQEVLKIMGLSPVSSPALPPEIAALNFRASTT